MIKKLKDILEGCLFTDGDWIESKDQDPKGEIRLIQLADIGDGNFIDKSSRFINKETANKLKCTFLKKGDVLVARMPDPLGRACVFPFDEENRYITAVDVCIIRPKENCLASYLKYVINSVEVRNTIFRQKTGTTRERITRKKLGELQIPLPPLEQQKKIAAILDAADTYRQKTKALIAKYDELTQSLFLDMFGDLVNNQKGWKYIEFGEIFNSLRYGTSSPPIYSNEGIPFIRATNVKNGSISKKGLVYISQEEACKIEKCKLKESDLIIVRSGANTGDCSRIPKEYEGSYGAFDIIVEIDEPYSTFYNFLLNTNSGKVVLEPLTRRAGQPHLNSAQIKELKVFEVPIDLQTQFAERVQAIGTQKVQAQASLEKAEELFNSLLQRAFKGEL
jgi:type I restriction enzyme S subunit